MASRFVMRHRVAFADTDAAGIVHFPRYFLYMEETEHAFLRSLGLKVYDQGAEQLRTWPRVHAACDYRQPLRFEDEFDVELLVQERGDKTVKYLFLFRAADQPGAVPLAQGTITVIHAVRRTGEPKLRAATIPPSIAALIEPADPTLLVDLTPR